MVVNTMTAQKFVYDNGINASNIRHIWEVLVNGVCENYRLRGTLYRSGMVYVGNSFRVIHIPEKAENIKFRMNSLFKFCDTWKDSIIKACIVHFYFVYIHPFCDGNGRMARVWMNKILSNIDSNFRGLVISSEINKHLNEYYYSLSESEYSYNKIIDITTFIEYVLRLIANAVDKSGKEYRYCRLE